MPSQMAVVQHSDEVSGRQEASFDSAGHASSTHHEAYHGFHEDCKIERNQVGEGEDVGTVQTSEEAHLQCFHEAAASEFRTLVQLNEDLQTSIIAITSVCKDAVSQQTSAPASSDSCRAHLARDSSSAIETSCFKEQNGNGVGNDNLEESGSEDECTSTRICAIHTAGIWRKRIRRGLLGESGQVIKTAHEALKEIMDVHSSDELMHFELCGPFWELSEV
jgi:hypothetical protein